MKIQFKIILKEIQTEPDDRYVCEREITIGELKYLLEKTPTKPFKTLTEEEIS